MLIIHYDRKYYFYLEHSGRGRKPKTDDSSDQSNVIPKKRAAVESKHI